MFVWLALNLIVSVINIVNLMRFRKQEREADKAAAAEKIEYLASTLIGDAR